MQPIIGSSEETTLLSQIGKSNNHAAEVNCSLLAVTAVAGRPSLSHGARGPGLNLSLRWCRSLSNRSLELPRSRLPQEVPHATLEPPSAALWPRFAIHSVARDVSVALLRPLGPLCPQRLPCRAVRTGIETCMQ